MATSVVTSNRRKVKTRSRFHVVTVGHADLDAAATTQVISLATDDNGRAFPVDCYIKGRWLVVNTDFSGGAVSALTCQVGDTDDPDELITATSVFTGASNVKPLSGNGAAGYGRWEAAYAPEALFTATDANVSVLTAGSVSIVIEIEEARLS